MSEKTYSKPRALKLKLASDSQEFYDLYNMILALLCTYLIKCPPPSPTRKGEYFTLVNIVQQLCEHLFEILKQNSRWATKPSFCGHGWTSMKFIFTPLANKEPISRTILTVKQFYFLKYFFIQDYTKRHSINK